MRLCVAILCRFLFLPQGMHQKFKDDELFARIGAQLKEKPFEFLPGGAVRVKGDAFFQHLFRSGDILAISQRLRQNDSGRQI